MEREFGFYWVRHNDLWEVAEYIPSIRAWFLIGSSIRVEDSYFAEINESIIKRC